MITLQELYVYLDKILSCSDYLDFCENGLQVEGKSQIRRIAMGVTANLSTIQAAVDWGADALIVHHGLFWNKDKYALLGIKREKLHLLLSNDISLLAFHLPLDAHKELGNNWKAAIDLGWKNLEPFGIFNGLPIGVKGYFNEIRAKDFQIKLESYYLHPAQIALGGPEIVRSAALISGGAHKSLSEAVEAGVDCFITGSFDEPNWYQAFEGNINFYALGHSATERVGPMALGEHLRKQFGIELNFLDVLNPF